MNFVDAAKRKQLPAWIREGLEKMEREKQKKLDKERQMKEREEELSKKRQEDEDALHNFDAGVIVKSKFVSCIFYLCISQSNFSPINLY